MKDDTELLNYDIPENIDEIEKQVKNMLFAKKRRTIIALLLASALRGNFQGDREAWREWVKRFAAFGKKEPYQLVSVGNMLLDLKAINKPLYDFGAKLIFDKLMALTTVYNVKKNEHDIARVISFFNVVRFESIERAKRTELYWMIHVFLGKETQEKKPVEQSKLSGFDKVLDGVLRIETSKLAEGVTDSGKARLYVNSGLRIFAAGLEYVKRQPGEKGSPLLALLKEGQVILDAAQKSMNENAGNSTGMSSRGTTGDAVNSTGMSFRQQNM